jgi:hypothetical protein
MIPSSLLHKRLVVTVECFGGHQHLLLFTASSGDRLRSSHDDEPVNREHITALVIDRYRDSLP